MVITGRHMVFLGLAGAAVLAVAVTVSILLGGTGRPSSASVPTTATTAASATPVAQHDALRALGAVDRALAATPERTLRRIENTCADLKRGEFGRDALVEQVRQRFDGTVAVDTLMAGRIVDAIESTKVCASF